MSSGRFSFRYFLGFRKFMRRTSFIEISSLPTFSYALPLKMAEIFIIIAEQMLQLSSKRILT